MTTRRHLEASSRLCPCVLCGTTARLLTNSETGALAWIEALPSSDGNIAINLTERTYTVVAYVSHDAVQEIQTEASQPANLLHLPTMLYRFHRNPEVAWCRKTHPPAKTRRASRKPSLTAQLAAANDQLAECRALIVRMLPMLARVDPPANATMTRSLNDGVPGHCARCGVACWLYTVDGWCIPCTQQACLDTCRAAGG